MSTSIQLARQSRATNDLHGLTLFRWHSFIHKALNRMSEITKESFQNCKQDHICLLRSNFTASPRAASSYVYARCHNTQKGLIQGLDMLVWTDHKVLQLS